MMWLQIFVKSRQKTRNQKNKKQSSGHCLNIKKPSAGASRVGRRRQSPVQRLQEAKIKKNIYYKRYKVIFLMRTKALLRSPREGRRRQSPAQRKIIAKSSIFKHIFYSHMHQIFSFQADQILYSQSVCNRSQSLFVTEANLCLQQKLISARNRS